MTVPRPASEPAYVAETLAWCNARRAEKGKKPLKKLPKGRRGIGDSCPCGKATNLWVGNINYRAGKFTPTLGELPLPVKEFVAAFDDGKLPQYEARS